MKMESEDDSVEMNLLQDHSLNEYVPLFDTLQKRHLAVFKSRIKRALKERAATFDINFVLPHPISMRFLDKAAAENLGSFVEFLLEVGADPNLINEDHKRAPIHFAAEGGNAEALTELLKAKNIQPNLEVNQMTALHFAVARNCQVCVRLLLEAYANPNIPNSRGLTALHFAADKNLRDMVVIILQDSKVSVDLDSYKDRRKETARQSIEKKFPDLTLPEFSESKDFSSLLRYFLNAKDEDSFIRTLTDADNLDSVENKNELLKLAVKHNLQRATAELMKRREFEKVIMSNLYGLCIEAVQQGNFEILKKLLAQNSSLANRLILPACQELAIPISPGPKNRNNRLECVKIILNQDDIDVRQQDDKSNTPLHYAARAECGEAIVLLLRKGSYIGHMNSYGAPPLANIPPGILEEHFNECLQSANEHTEEYEITINYENLKPHCAAPKNSDDYLDRRISTIANKAVCSETEALLYIADNKNLKHLLKHPLLSSFLYLKYLRIRHVLYVNFFLYLMYYVCLMTYVWFITSDEQETEELMRKSNFSNEDSSVTPIIDNGMFENWQNRPILSALVAVTSIYLIIRETLQLISSPLHYLTSPENWLELLLVGLTISLLLGAGREIGAIVILISTWELIILMSQHPKMARDIEMFKTVTVNFLKFLFLYIFMILAFAFSFFVLFKSNEEDNFFNPVGSLFKTIIMITGELDSSDLPFAVYPILSRFVFIGFIFLIVIILLNLLNGLAVNDTGEILSQAELVCLVSRARLVAYAERVAVSSPFVPKTNFCCWLNSLPMRNLASGPMRFMARRIQLFPNYLPQAQLSVKYLKNYEIKLHGRTSKGSRCSTLKMDSIIAQRAKEILSDRDRETNDEKILSRLSMIEQKFDGLANQVLLEIREALRNNNEANQN